MKRKWVAISQAIEEVGADEEVGAEAYVDIFSDNSPANVHQRADIKRGPCSDILVLTKAEAKRLLKNLKKELS